MDVERRTSDFIVLAALAEGGLERQNDSGLAPEAKPDREALNPNGGPWGPGPNRNRQGAESGAPGTNGFCTSSIY
jgi:hypothetical protein